MLICSFLFTECTNFVQRLPFYLSRCPRVIMKDDSTMRWSSHALHVFCWISKIMYVFLYCNGFGYLCFYFYFSIADAASIFTIHTNNSLCWDCRRRNQIVLIHFPMQHPSKDLHLNPYSKCFSFSFSFLFIRRLYILFVNGITIITTIIVNEHQQAWIHKTLTAKISVPVASVQLVGHH